MPRVIVFDVIETLLDLTALDPHFQRLFSDKTVRREWFMQMLQTGLVTTILGTYKDFGQVGGAALQMTAERHGLALAEEEKKQILSSVRSLPPHPDAREALEQLRRAGLRLATLTNSTQAVAQEQLKFAGLTEYFDQVLSADTARRLKPAPQVYQMAATSLGVSTSEMRMVAAHGWDVAGALHAGCAAALVVRPGMPPDPLLDKPDVVGQDLREVAERIIDIERS